MGTEDINHNQIYNEGEPEDTPPALEENFSDYQWEKKVHKNTFKKKLSQVKRLLVNRASNEYSQVDEQNETKTIPKMLVSVSKINDLKGKFFTVYIVFSPSINCFSTP